MFILRNVRHLSELNKNLISLDMLDSMDFNFKSKHDNIKVCKELLVHFSNKLKNGLDILNGIVESKDAIGTYTNVDVNHCHKRLGHIISRTLGEIDKKKYLSDELINEMTFWSLWD